MRLAERVLVALLPTTFVVGALAPGAAVEPADSSVLFTFADERIQESSGLVARGSLVVTVNDSGDTNRVFTVDAATGETVGVSSWPGEAVDIEALAPTADAEYDELLVGDIGDNLASRDEIAVSRVLFGRGDGDADAVRWRFVYSDGPHDAETLLVHPGTGRIYIVTKGFIGQVYEAPAVLDPDGLNELVPLEDPDGRVLGIATDGAFFPDGKHLILRNYGQAAVYTWPALERLGTFDLPTQPQGEGLAVSEGGEILVSSEGEHTEVLRVRLPSDIRAAMTGADPDAPEEYAELGPVPEESDDAGDTASAPDERDWWPWLLGGGVGLLTIVVLIRSLRPR